MRYQSVMPYDDEARWTRDPLARRGLELIGSALRRKRRRLGITQTELQRRTGVDQTTISRIENGRRFGLRWHRFARVVAELDGLDFGHDPAQLLGPMGLSPNPTVARQQIEVLERHVESLRERVERRETDLDAS